MENSDWRKERRQHGGSIKMVGDKIYARVQYRDTSGRRKEKLRRATSRKEARSLIKQMRTELENHGTSILKADKLRFAELAERYSDIRLVPAVYSDGRKAAGKRSIGPSRSALRVLVKHFGRMQVRTIKPSDVEAFKVKRLAQPVLVEVKVKTKREGPGRKKFDVCREVRSRPRKIASVNRELQLLRAVFNFAKAEGLLITSPFENGTRLISAAAENSRDRVLSISEELRLLDACSGKRAHLRPLVITAMDTGARRGELFKLRWRDVDLFGGTLVIQATNSKTERMRIIGLTQRVKEELTTIWDVSAKDPNDLVFGISNTVKTAWKTACRDAGISGFRFHDLRHTATTRLIRAGVSHSEAMKITGHSQMKTFLRYLNLTTESVTHSANVLDQFLARQLEGTKVPVVSSAIS